MSKKLLTFIFGIIFLISILSSASGYFLPTKDYNQETETIKIDNAFGIFGKVAEYNLTYNTEQCLINCYAEGTATLHEDGKLFYKLNFENRGGKEINLENNIYIWKNESYEVDITDYKDECNNLNNGTSVCEKKEIGSHKETRYKQEWKVYEGENLDKGNYKWRIEGKKKLGQSVDWIASAFGVDFKEWAWWDNNWNYKRQVNLTANVGNFSYINLSYYANMQTDFDDLRFIDCATESIEYNHTVESFSASNYVIERIHSHGENCFYIYYGNAGASSTSSSYNTHFKPISYWYLDEASGTLVDFATGNNNGTNSGASYGATGKIANSMDFESTELDSILLGQNTIDLTSTLSINMFVRPESLAGTAGFLSIPTGTNGYGFYYSGGTIRFGKIGVSETDSGDGLSTGVYQGISVTYNGSTAIFYINGTSVANNLYSTSFSSGINYALGNSGGNYYDGLMDEVGVWDYELTNQQIKAISNYTTPTIVVGNEQNNNQIIVNLNSPVNNYNSTNATINFNCSATDDVGLIWLNLSVDGNYIHNVTGDGTTNLTLINSTTLSQGNHNWTCSASDGTGINDPKTEIPRNLTIDSIFPTINLSVGNGTFNFGILTTNHTINYTITDTNLDSCWLNYNLTNRTIPCTSGVLNTTNFTLQYNVYNATIYANDTFGNSASLFFNWSYRLFFNYQTYSSSIYEGLPTTFTANFLTNGTAITVANLSYNGTVYEGTISNHGGNNFTVSRTITVPSVSANYNASVFWNISQNGFYYSLTPFNQTILNLAVDDCSVLTNVLYNFTMRDEENNNILNNYTAHNTTAKLNLQIYGYGSSNLIQEFNKTYSDTNPFAVCLTSNLSSGEGSFNIDAQIQFTADDYVTRLYHLQNETINSSSFTTNITLRLLNSTNAQSFKVIYRDQSFIPVQDALIKVYKKYISENEYKIVEIPKTDGKGTVSVNLVLNKELYKIEVVKYGVILSTFTDMIAICQTPLVSTCEIDLNAVADSIVIPDYEEGEDFLFTIGYNNITRTISSEFSIPSGEIVPISLNVSREDALGSFVCSDILTSNSGTLTCVVPESFGNSTITAVLYRSGEFQAQGSIKLNQNPVDLYGSVLVMLALFIMITLFGAGISDNPVYSVIFLMVGVILLYALNLIANNGFIGATATILFLVIAVILIIVKGARRN